MTRLARNPVAEFESFLNSTISNDLSSEIENIIENAKRQRSTPQQQQQQQHSAWPSPPLVHPTIPDVDPGLFAPTALLSSKSLYQHQAQQTRSRPLAPSSVANVPHDQHQTESPSKKRIFAPNSVYQDVTFASFGDLSQDPFGSIPGYTSVIGATKGVQKQLDNSVRKQQPHCTQLFSSSRPTSTAPHNHGRASVNQQSSNIAPLSSSSPTKTAPPIIKNDPLLNALDTHEDTGFTTNISALSKKVNDLQEQVGSLPYLLCYCFRQHANSRNNSTF
jgi:hypothetical protein